MVGFDDLTERRIWRLVHSDDRPSKFSGYTEFEVHKEEHKFVIKVHYVLCSGNIFSDDIEQTVIENIDPTSATLFDIIEYISNHAKISQEQAIELYSSEGYPLQNNEITSKGMWVI